MSASGSGIFEWDLLEEAPSVTSFALDPTEAEERDFEQTILEGAGRAADALAGSSSDPSAPDTQEDSHYVKCELLTQDALQAKMKEMDEAMGQLRLSLPGGADATGSETSLGEARCCDLELFYTCCGGGCWDFEHFYSC